MSNTEPKEHDLENHFYNELKASYSTAQFPKMFKITRCLLKKGVLANDERILGKENLMDFLAFTQRFATKQIESESENGDSETHFRTFGFSNRSSSGKIKKRNNYKKDKKRWKKICQALVQRGVSIPLTLLKNPVAKKYFH